ncbi:hypothetical protein DFJ73DRAFT_198775 [Zopfochytrium polystomum]|nr:hypothetical protein DFJ73DRAFT_198775 [Zopfochytrium polystomum]
MLEQQQKVKFASSDDLLSRHTLPESISIPSNISSVSDDALSVEQLDAEKQRRESVENASIEAADELKVSTRDLWIDSYKVKNSATAYPQIRRESEPPVSGVSSDERVIIRMLQSENDALKMALELERAQQNELSNSKRLLSATHEENLEKIAELEKINSRLRKAQEESEQDISEKIREAVKSKEREVAAIRERLDVAEEDLAIQTDENAKLNWKCAETKSLYAKSQQECLSLQTQIEQLEKALHSANDSLLEKDLEIQAMQQTTSQTRLELEQQKKEALQREASFAEQAEKRERELTLEASATIQQQKEEMVGKAANMIQTAVAEKEDVIAALNVRIEQVEERLQIHAKEAEQAKIKWNEERNESTAAAAALAEKVRDLEAENEALRNEAEAERVQLTKATEKNENLLLELQNLQRFVTEEETERNRHSNDLQVWEMRFQEMESQKAALRLERDAIDARLHECLAHLEVQSSKFELVREDDAKRHQEEYQRWLSSLEVEKRKIADSERAHESLNRDYSEALNTIKLLEDANRSLKEQLRREAELSKEKSNDIKRLNKTLNSMKQAQVRFDGELQKAQEAEVSSSNAREALERENRTLTKEVTAIQAQFRAFEPQHSELSSNIYLGSPEQIAVDGPTQSDAQQADNSTERSIQQNEPHEQGGLIDFKKDVDALSELQDSHKELEKTCKELTEEIAVRGRQMALQNEQISRLQEEKEVLCAAQSDQQSRFEHDILQLREDCDQYSQQVITLEFELEAAKAALAAALDSLNEVRKLNEELEVRKSEISAFVRTLESEVGSQQKALEEATEQRNVFEEQARNAESALEQRTAEFDQRSNELKGQIDALQSALGIRSADHEAFLLSKSRVSELESALAAKSTEFEELANKADGEKRHLEAALAENRSLVAQLRAEVESLDCWRLQLSAELEDKSAAENLHRAKVEELQNVMSFRRQTQPFLTPPKLLNPFNYPLRRRTPLYFA